jgi:cytohesin
MAIAGENEPVIEYLMSLGAKRGTLGRIVDEATEEALAMAMEGEAAYEADTGLRLVEAVANRDHEAIKTLLRGGTDVNGQYHGMTPLIASISREGDLSTLGFLLQNGADPNAPAESGMTPLASACMASRADAVRALLKAGARVNDPAIGGMPAMEFAKMENNEEIMSILKKAGAKP